LFAGAVMGVGARWSTVWAAAVAVALSLRAAPVQAFGVLLFAALLQQYRETALQFKEDPLTGNQPALPEYDFIIVRLTSRFTKNK